MGHDFGLVAVHPRHWDHSTFAVWHEYYEEYGPAVLDRLEHRW